jgi:hypothetical protein
MPLRSWLQTSGTTVVAFSRQIGVERCMVYRYFTGAMPRLRTMRRIELLTGGAVTAQDFYEVAMTRLVPAEPRQSGAGARTGAVTE